MEAGHLQFQDWQQRRGFSGVETAEYLGLDAFQVSRLKTPGFPPNLKTAIKVERGTGIPVEAWLADDAEMASAIAAPARKRKIAKRARL